MSAIEDTMKSIQQVEEVRMLRIATAQMRHYLSCALCAQCGDPLGTGEITQTSDGERTVHAGKCLAEAEEGDPYS